MRKKTFKGVIPNSGGGYEYIGADRKIAHKFGLITLPENVSGTNCGNCIFQNNKFCDHKKVLLPVTKKMCCSFWDNKTLRSLINNIFEANLFTDRSSMYPLNKLGGYDYHGTALGRAKNADLITLPKNIEGTNCAEKNCMYGKHNFCIHPKIMLPVTKRMSCSVWDNKSVKRLWGKIKEVVFG